MVMLPVTITLNPFQGLKPFFRHDRNNTTCVTITLNPFQGLKHKEVSILIFIRVTITLNPFQGLKHL